jgi:hypothetical protein
MNEDRTPAPAATRLSWGFLGMQFDLTASHDACQQSVCCFENERRFSHWPRRALRGLKAGIRLSACITVAAGMVVASAATSEAVQLPGLSGVQASPAAVNDPLGAIVPVPAAETSLADLQRQIIVSIPLTNPPTSEGDDEDHAASEPVEYVEFEEMRVPRWIVDTILRASDLTSADPVYMMALADKESSFLPGNKASTSSAVGLFQFISSTWLEAVRSFGPKHGLIMEAKAIKGPQGQLSVPDETLREHILGLRRNPYLSALMAAEMMKRDKEKIENRLGRKLSRSEFYLSHFFGVDSASKFIALVDDTPKKSAPSAFPAAARSNKALFFAKDGKKTRQLSVAEVYGKIDTMIDKRLDRYEDVSTRATADASY